MESDDRKRAKQIQNKIDAINREIEKSKMKYDQSVKLSSINQRNRDINIQMDNEAGKRKRATEKKTIGTEDIDPFARYEGDIL